MRLRAILEGGAVVLQCWEGKVAMCSNDCCLLVDRYSRFETLDLSIRVVGNYRNVWYTLARSQLCIGLSGFLG